jgi:hypothetical protein
MVGDPIRARLYSIPRGHAEFDVEFTGTYMPFALRASSSLKIQAVDDSTIPLGEYELVWDHGMRSTRVTNKGIGWQMIDFPN